MTEFEKTVVKFIGRQEEATKNLKEDVNTLVKKLNGVDIHKLRDDVENQGKKLWYLTGAGAAIIFIIPIAKYIWENF